MRKVMTILLAAALAAVGTGPILQFIRESK
jgi:hypothetical protein